MYRKTDTVIARTIGIDTGKNTLHLIGLDAGERSFCARRSLAAGLQHDLRMCRSA